MLNEIVKTSSVVPPGHQRKHVLLASMYFFSLGFPSKLCLTSHSWGHLCFPSSKRKEKAFIFLYGYLQEQQMKNDGGSFNNSVPIYRWARAEPRREAPWQEGAQNQGRARQAGTGSPPASVLRCRHSCLTLVPRPAWHLGSPGSGPTSAANSCVTSPRCNCRRLHKVAAGAWKGQLHKGHEDCRFSFV